MRMPFGKYRGVELNQIDRSYLRWLLDNTDIAGSKPGLANRITAIVATRLQASEYIEVSPLDAPTFWGYAIRGGGAMQDGVTSLCRLMVVDGQIVRDAAAVANDNRSGSRRSGSVHFEAPYEDGVYEWRETSGSIRNHSSSPTMGLLYDGHWFSLLSPADALAVLMGREVHIVGGGVFTMQPQEV